mgnify:CR=1 FL=1
MSYPQLKTNSIFLIGADPEIFIEENGQIVGSEKLIPEEGSYAGEQVKLIRDGVQVELNLSPTHSRNYFAFEIKLAMNHLQELLDVSQRYTVSFREVVDVSTEELASLTPMSRRLGCAPSFNWYSPLAAINVDPETFTGRSAGGHLHFGLPDYMMSERNLLPPLCDIIIGNTSVLLDRDPLAATRREVYGRAGEFRVPRHGFEYRTLSNFWLRSPKLVNLMTGLMRLVVYILDTSIHDEDSGGWEADTELFKLVNLDNVQRAINTNDFKLAKANFEGVKVFLTQHLWDSSKCKGGETSLDGKKLSAFNTFIEGIDQGGLEHWFKEDPMTEWTQEMTLTASNWEHYLHTTVEKGAEIV